MCCPEKPSLSLDAARLRHPPSQPHRRVDLTRYFTHHTHTSERKSMLVAACHVQGDMHFYVDKMVRERWLCRRPLRTAMEVWCVGTAGKSRTAERVGGCERSPLATCPATSRGRDEMGLRVTKLIPHHHHASSIQPALTSHQWHLAWCASMGPLAWPRPGPTPKRVPLCGYVIPRVKTSQTICRITYR